MVPEEGVARLSLGGHAIGLCGAAPGFRAPKVALFLLFVGARSRFAPHGPALGKRLVPEEGGDPSRPCGHGILSPARLPVPPLRRRPERSAPDVLYTLLPVLIPPPRHDFQ